MWRIRPYESHDRDEVMELASRLAVGVAGWRDVDRFRSCAREWVEASITSAENGDGEVFVATEDPADRRVAGFVSVASRPHFTGDVDAYVGELVVATWAEGTGAGRALMAAAESWARARGLARLTLETGAANTAARAFYGKLGYLDEEVRLTKTLEVEPAAASS